MQVSGGAVNAFLPPIRVPNEVWFPGALAWPLLNPNLTLGPDAQRGHARAPRTPNDPNQTSFGSLMGGRRANLNPKT